MGYCCGGCVRHIHSAQCEQHQVLPREILSIDDNIGQVLGVRLTWPTGPEGKRFAQPIFVHNWTVGAASVGSAWKLLPIFAPTRLILDADIAPPPTAVSMRASQGAQLADITAEGELGPDRVLLPPKYNVEAGKYEHDDNGMAWRQAPEVD